MAFPIRAGPSSRVSIQDQTGLTQLSPWMPPESGDCEKGSDGSAGMCSWHLDCVNSFEEMAT